MIRKNTISLNKICCASELKIKTHFMSFYFVLHSTCNIFALMKIAVFCSANADIDPDFFKMTEEFGRWAARKGHAIVFGGCNMGLMECVAKAAHDAGGMTIGVVPMIIERGGRKSGHVDVTIPCDNLSDRKDLMIARSDVAVALPGGIGTLDEIFTVAAAGTIGYHSKRVILFNMKGFWKPLVALLHDMSDNGMIRGDWHSRIAVADSMEELAALLDGEEA